MRNLTVPPILLLMTSLAALPAAHATQEDGAAPPARSMTIPAGQAQLAATIQLPAPSTDGAAPKSGVVLLHGSGPSTRDLQKPLAHWFLARGMAVLSFDKRGCGESTGDWTRTSLDELAADAAAALEALRAQPELKDRPVGFFGHSQAGWVIPRSAALGAQPSFALVVAGGGARPTTVETYGYRRTFEAAGLTDPERERGFRWIERYFEYLRSCRDRTPLAQGLEAERGQPWLKLARLERILVSEETCPQWSWVASYDPLSDIARLRRLKLLVLFGRRDTASPSDISLARWQEGLAQAGNSGAQVELLAGEGHGLGLGMHHGPPPGSVDPDAVDTHAVDREAASGGGTYLEVIETWLRARGYGADA